MQLTWHETWNPFGQLMVPIDPYETRGIHLVHLYTVSAANSNIL